jgi:hypothetical protein
MPERNARRPSRRSGAPKMPPTLSLPAIPRAPGESSVPVRRPAERASLPTRTSQSIPRRAPELLPSPTDWEDDYAAAIADRSYSYGMDDDGGEMAERATARRSLVTVSPSGIRTSGRQRAVGPILPPVKLGPTPRSLRRTLVWQMLLALIAIVALGVSIRGAAPPPSAYASAFQAASAVQVNTRVVDRVPIQTQLDPTIGYDSPAQYKEYSDAACGAASTSSVLLAWGDPKGHVGQVIDDMIPYIQPIGMVDPVDGFHQVAVRHGFNVVITDNITAAQIAEIVTVQGIPVVVGIRDTSGGYYSYFSPGHFLVIVGADPNGFRVVDNSTYFVHYFPTATFLSLWDHPRATIYYPKGYDFQMP